MAKSNDGKGLSTGLNSVTNDATILNDALLDITKTINAIDITDPFKSIGVLFESFTEQLTEIPKAIQGLDEAASKLVRTLGVTRERAGEFVSTISSAVPMFAKMGLNMSDIVTTFESVTSAFGTNVSLNEKALSSLKGTSIVSGVEMKTLAGNFKDVGVSINDVGGRMLEVTNVARQSGALVSAVSAGVVANLGKMNLYNFEGGTKGLAKMAAQASKLGVDLNAVFVVVDKVFNPEGAIEMAASLQRLGVTSSQLLDPLRLMDLSQNDPTELMNQIGKMTKEFTFFNKQNNQIEILPGAKRRLEEIGKAMGFNNHELQTMAVNAGNLEYKMKQLKFSPDIKDEDRELVATMSQIGKKGTEFAGKAIVQVEEKNDKGQGTGVYIDKLIKDLKPEDVEMLAQQQLDSSMSMEDIAHKQLDQLKQLNSNINEKLGSIKYGVAGSKSVQEGYKGTIKTIDEGIIGKIDDLITMMGMENSLTPENIGKGIDVIISKSGDLFEMGYKKVIDITDEYLGGFLKSIKSTFGVGGGEDGIGDDNSQTAKSSVMNANPNSTVANALSNSTNTTTNNTTTKTELTITHSFDFSKLPANMTTAQIESILTEWAKNPINANELVMAAAKINSGIINV